MSEYSSVTDISLTDWVLQIKFVQPRDAGIYECQVSTEPRISENFHLNVVGKQLMGDIFIGYHNNKLVAKLILKFNLLKKMEDII